MTDDPVPHVAMENESAFIIVWGWARGSEVGMAEKSGVEGEVFYDAIDWEKNVGEKLSNQRSKADLKQDLYMYACNSKYEMLREEI